MQADKKERAQAIQGLRRTYKLDVLLKLDGMAKSTFYYNLAASRAEDPDAVLKKHIRAIYHKHKGRYGYRRITLCLQAEGIPVNHKKVERIMKELGLKAVVRVVKYRSYKGDIGQAAPNLLERNFKAEQPLKKLATDVSQVKIGDRKGYISPVMDMFNGEILTCDVSDRPDLAQTERMLKDLFRVGGDGLEGAILHSDQGWQYQHRSFQDALRAHGPEHVPQRELSGQCHDGKFFWFNEVRIAIFGKLYDDGPVQVGAERVYSVLQQ